MKSMAQAYEALRIAQCNEDNDQFGLASSAKLAALNAAVCFNVGNYDSCWKRAEDSLQYSIGRDKATKKLEAIK